MNQPEPRDILQAVAEQSLAPPPPPRLGERIAPYAGAVILIALAAAIVFCMALGCYELWRVVTG